MRRLLKGGARARSWARSPYGTMLLVGLTWSIAWMVTAATLGNRSYTDLPITPLFIGREYDAWAFPLSPNDVGYRKDSVARSVIIIMGLHDHDVAYSAKADAIIRENVIRNLIANAPIYGLSSIPGILTNVGHILSKILVRVKSNHGSV